MGLCISQSPKLSFYSFLLTSHPGRCRSLGWHREQQQHPGIFLSTQQPQSPLQALLWPCVTASAAPHLSPWPELPWVPLSLQGVAQVTLLFGVYLLICSPPVDSA